MKVLIYKILTYIQKYSEKYLQDALNFTCIYILNDTCASTYTSVNIKLSQALCMNVLCAFKKSIRNCFHICTHTYIHTSNLYIYTIRARNICICFANGSRSNLCRFDIKIERLCAFTCAFTCRRLTLQFQACTRNHCKQSLHKQSLQPSLHAIIKVRAITV